MTSAAVVTSFAIPGEKTTYSTVTTRGQADAACSVSERWEREGKFPAESARGVVLDWDHHTVPAATLRPVVAVTPQDHGNVVARFSRKLNPEVWVDVTEDGPNGFKIRRVMFALTVPSDVDRARFAGDVVRATRRYDEALQRAGRRTWLDRLLRRP